MSVARRGASGQARAGKRDAPRLHAMLASLPLPPLPLIPLPAIVHRPRQERGCSQHNRGGDGVVRRLLAEELNTLVGFAKFQARERRYTQPAVSRTSAVETSRPLEGTYSPASAGPWRWWARRRVC